MFDDPQNHRPADHYRVNVSATWERSYWCNVYGCTAAQLRAAVYAVGVRPADVQALLAKHVPPARRPTGLTGGMRPAVDSYPQQCAD